jgi:queuine/archaeosine tRNA-ribosyltransferase
LDDRDFLVGVEAGVDVVELVAPPLADRDSLLFLAFFFFF